MSIFVKETILFFQPKVLRYLLEKETANDHWNNSVIINQIGSNVRSTLSNSLRSWKLAFKDQWISKANCLHLAARFNPKGLHIILSHLKDKESLIQDTHKDGQVSPLHVAATKMDSRSTRFDN